MRGGLVGMNEPSKTDHGIDSSMVCTTLRHLFDSERGEDLWVDATLEWWNR